MTIHESSPVAMPGKTRKKRYISPHLDQRLRFGFAAACALAILAGTASTALSAGEGDSFVDDFASFDRAHWYVSDGWANADWQNCLFSKKQLKLADGIISFSFDKKKSESREYACAEIQSRKVYHYGTYEARLKSGAGSGMVSAFFSYIGPQQKKPHDEIDFEVLMRDTSKVTVNTFVSGKAMHGASAEVAGNTDSGFNDYAFVWEKDRLRWYVNGKLVHEVTSQDGPLPTNPQKIFASIWGSDTFTDWLGAFEEPPGPVVMQVDRIAFTRLGDPCQFPESVACGLE